MVSQAINQCGIPKIYITTLGVAWQNKSSGDVVEQFVQEGQCIVTYPIKFQHYLLIYPENIIFELT